MISLLDNCTPAAAAHTPGPFHLEDNWVVNDRAVRVAVVDTADMNAGIDQAEAEANALLFMLAPELLDTLTACMFALGRGGANVAGGPGRAEWERARAAIAAATGVPG